MNKKPPVSKPSPTEQQGHPDVHKVSQANMDYITRGIIPAINPRWSTGSVNMLWLMCAWRYFSDHSSKHEAEVIDALDYQEVNGYLTWRNGECEQGISAPHIELVLNAMGTMLLDSLRPKNKNPELTGRLVKFFISLYAMGLSCSTSKGYVIMPGVRMVKWGPHSAILDGVIKAIDGRVVMFKQVAQHLFRDNVGAWCVLEALKINPHLFDGVKGWKIDDAGLSSHWPVLRWPLKVERYDHGHVASFTVPVADVGAMMDIGATGVGCSEVRTWETVPGPAGEVGIGWRAYDTGRWFGTVNGETDLGGLVRTLQV